MKIGNLKKVLLAIGAGAEKGSSTLTPEPVAFSFIYGIAAEGISPFESALYEKRVGEVIAITVSASETSEFFAHLLLPLREQLKLLIMPETLCLEITVKDVFEADNREVVQAIAGAAGQSGCGGSCGCGCG